MGAYEDVNASNYAAAACMSVSEWTCVYDVRKKQSENDEYLCDTLSALQCSETSYDISTSYGAYPGTYAQADPLQRIYSRSPTTNATLSAVSDIERAYYLQSNVAYVSIYFDSLDYVKIVTESGYTLLNLCSDLGGTFGFWMGLS